MSKDVRKSLCNTYVLFNDDIAYFVGSKEECIVFAKAYNEALDAHGEESGFSIARADYVSIE